jgi:hypothetical protein
MGCKNCQSSQLKVFQGEVSLVFPGIRRIHQASVYFCPQILICLDCGASEFFISAQELELLRKGMANSSLHADANGG